MSTRSLVGSGTVGHVECHPLRHRGENRGATLRTGLARTWLLLGAVIAAFAAVAPAKAQVVLIVNGDPITALDIEQRAKLVQLTLHKTVSRQELIDDLIDDKIKISVGRRFHLDITADDVDKSFVDMGGRMHLTRQAFEQVLTQNGIDPSTMKDHIKAEISWATVVQGKFQSRLHVNDKDVLQAMEGSKDAKPTEDGQKTNPENPKGYEYVLRPILFVIGRGAAADVKEARKKEAEALRARFENCEAGIPTARTLRDVVVREQIIRSSDDLQGPIRQILDGVPVGHLTAPEVTSRGVELFALCAKREAKLESSAKNEVKNKLFSEKFETQGKRFLQELRKAAMIEYKEPVEPIKDVKGKKAPKASRESNAKASGVKTQ
jgi:peptidyl-prolyl cis-trans isomerase SurA